MDSPESIHQKIIDDKICSRNATMLITLTREPLPEPYLRANKGGFAGGEHRKERTDKFYVEIEKVAGEIEKGSKGGLRTRKGIQDAVDAIQQGKSVEKALKHTNFNFFCELNHSSGN